MYDPIKMNPENQPQDDANIEVLVILDEIEHNTAVTKGWMTFFGILVIIGLVIYLTITFIGLKAFLTMFTSTLG